jgi:tRNA-splicing ligase RtcB
MAIEFCVSKGLALPTKDLAYFPIHSTEHEMYRTAMEFGMAYAYANRVLMLRTIQTIIEDTWAGSKCKVLVNVHHNYAAWENHFGEDGIVHRKGAIRARIGDMLLIPGSMGTSSYIGAGLGNPDSYNTCQHGAGRAMGRREADRKYEAGELENLGTFMGDRNILMGGHASEAIDEHPKAYKDIEQVMLDSADLVEPINRMTPLGVVKG